MPPTRPWPLPTARCRSRTPRAGGGSSRSGARLIAQQSSSQRLGRLTGRTRRFAKALRLSRSNAEDGFELPDSVTTCADLDGVLTDSGVLHAWAWGEVFDELLLRLSETTGWHFIPFDHDCDYRDYIDGRARLDGDLVPRRPTASSLPEGRYERSARCGHRLRAGTSQGRSHGTRAASARRRAVPGARRYLEASGHAGLKRAVVAGQLRARYYCQGSSSSQVSQASSTSASTPMVIRTEGLRSRPAPDLLLGACRRLGTRPVDAVQRSHTAQRETTAKRPRSRAVTVVGASRNGTAGPGSGCSRAFGAERVAHVPACTARPSASAAPPGWKQRPVSRTRHR